MASSTRDANELAPSTMKDVSMRPAKTTTKQISQIFCRKILADSQEGRMKEDFLRGKSLKMTLHLLPCLIPPKMGPF